MTFRQLALLKSERFAIDTRGVVLIFYELSDSELVGT
jgi:hypothetical protein